MSFNTLTLTEALKKLKANEISLEEMYTDTLSEIEKTNKDLNVYLHIDQNSVKLAKEKKNTPLGGVPIAVKDNFLTVGQPTTASSSVLEGFMPPYESTVTKRLMKAGVVIVGKTNMDAWAHGSSTETSDFGPTKNPRNTGHLPGGSSGGSAAAVAADLCIGAIGSETAGSIRQPSAWCGIVGLKPTYGRVSRYGVVAMGSSLDSPGPMGKTVEDTAILYEHLHGKDAFDATTSERSDASVLKSLTRGVRGLRIGICYIDHEKLKGSQVANSIEEAGKLFASLGAIVENIPLAMTPDKKRVLTPDYAVGVYTVVQRSEVSSNLARYDGIRFGRDRSVFGDEAKRRIMLGTFTLSKGYSEKYYVHAQKVRSLYIQNFKDLFGKYDVLISPTSPGFALPLGASFGNPMFGELEDLLLEPSSISGNPGISVPCYRDSKTNLYLGMNIVANHWAEEAMLRAAYAYEQATPWNSWKKQS